MSERGTKARATSRPWLLPVLFGVGFSVPALFVGFVFDDLLHRLWLEGRFEGIEPRWFGLYEFTSAKVTTRELVDTGALPWFTEPGLSLRFFRPLSSILLTFDHLAFGRRALPAHLHSLAWFTSLLVCVCALYRRWFRPPVALLASILYAIAGAHAIPTAWLASRHALVTATCSLMALWAWVRFREDGWRPGVWWAAGAWAASALAGETWLAGLALPLLYEWGTRPDWRSRLGGSAPFALVGVGYVVTYALCGYGDFHSALYVSPLEAPGQYLRVALTRMPLAYAELFGGMPVIVAGPNPSVQVFFIAWGLVLTLALGWGLIFSRSAVDGKSSQTLRWLGMAALGTPFLLIGTAVTGRVLLVPLVGATALVAHALAGAGVIRRGGRIGQRWVAATLLVVLGGAHLGLSPLARLAVPLVFAGAATAQQRVAYQTDLGLCPANSTAYMLSGSDPALSLYLGPSILFHAPDTARVERLRILSMAPQPLRLTRPEDRVLELAVEGRPRRVNDFERLYRAIDAPLTVGRTYSAGELSARVLEMADGYPARVRFELPTSFDASTVCLIAWRDGRVQPVSVPKQGQSVTIPYELGPTGM